MILRLAQCGPALRVLLGVGKRRWGSERAVPMTLPVLTLAWLALIAPNAAAHDFWLQPRAFSVRSGEPLPVALQVGHGAQRQRWPAGERILLFRDVSSAAVTDLLPAALAARPNQDPRVSLSGVGTHVLLLASRHARSELPGPRFTEYLKEEGLTPALELRARTDSSNRPGREIYSRRAKALIQVDGKSPASQAHVTQSLGLTLEIVPEVNPYGRRAGEPLPVTIYFEGKPLVGALVKMRNLNAGVRPVQSVTTGALGRAQLRMPGPGVWQLNVVWTKPLQGDPRADFETTFSSLTFGVPR